MKTKPYILLVSMLLFGLFLGAVTKDKEPQNTTIRETVTNWNQVGYLRLGNSNYEVLQGATFTNYVMKTKFEGREMSMVLKSDQGPVLTNWCDLRCIPTGGPGPVWTITPPMIPLPERPR